MIRERLSAFLDGELKEEECRRIAFHLESCDSCSREYEKMTQLKRILSYLDAVQPPPYLWQRVKWKITSPEKTSFWERLAHRFVYAPVGVAVLIGLLVGNHLGQKVFYHATQTEVELLNLSSLDDCPPGSLSDLYFCGWED